ncbi:lysine N(6)-hydroxylase/L-ornithine N(5)-oxygenase family protein [Flavivirga sp. 57AJ16]|uniref:lysine N(6)-hydroxylase/L-ornithine N(5)-oxygenase family protein n=1 Tax=Flavivirga sp. 57AJ16 TaxID=3025307 RepID=UPI0023666D04|nr:SidA/IucD/PvdA family monooxygenase [Flavivirga sp. 57AJ16]MDD7887572.1 SidA/IucD/PvdA family monooxygenase [Flavivirga sp. 57AJ16]
MSSTKGENKQKIYSLIGIGIGPFNLGLAALVHPIPELSSVFFDQKEKFDWHPGLMLDNATLQVPFLADLVTMADPTNEFSFLNYLKKRRRIYKFYIKEDFFLLRKEYNAYCQWVASKLDACKFSRKVIAVTYENGLYVVTVLNTITARTKLYYARKIVLGTGTTPHMPKFLNMASSPRIIHSSQYLHYRKQIDTCECVSIIGSGQSAAEIFRDQLPKRIHRNELKWFTRSPYFFPLESGAKFTLEFTSPEYTDHFYDLPYDTRLRLLSEQSGLYKGIDEDLINEIYNMLYEGSLEEEPLKVEIRSNMKLESISDMGTGELELKFKHRELNKELNTFSHFVILATGYSYKEPEFLNGINDRIQRFKSGRFLVQRNYTIDKNQSEVFVQNAELHTHGLATPDLGMGAYRNSCIINQIAGKEIYSVEKRIAFQEFGLCGTSVSLTQ